VGLTEIISRIPNSHSTVFLQAALQCDQYPVTMYLVVRTWWTLTRKRVFI